MAVLKRLLYLRDGVPNQKDCECLHFLGAACANESPEVEVYARRHVPFSCSLQEGHEGPHIGCGRRHGMYLWEYEDEDI